MLLIIHPFAQAVKAEKASMTGDFANDTVTVDKTLKENIAMNDDDANFSESKDEALATITAYISRYRYRPQVNSTSSFTTMQTALNAMAGHYKTFKNRPLPEQLKERLNKELSKAETLATNES